MLKRLITLSTRGAFLEVPMINGPDKLLPSTLKTGVTVCFASTMIKLSVDGTKWSSFLARTRALILFISI